MSLSHAPDHAATLREHLAAALKARGSLTVYEAWQIGYLLGIFTGGEWREARTALNAVGTRHPGYWRAIWPEEKRRAKRWSDYWTPKGARHVA